MTHRYVLGEICYSLRLRAVIVKDAFQQTHQTDTANGSSSEPVMTNDVCSEYNKQWLLLGFEGEPDESYVAGGK